MRLFFTVPDTPQTQNGVLLRNFLRQCAVSTDLARAVKFRGSGFFADGEPVLANRRAEQLERFQIPHVAITIAEAVVRVGIFVLYLWAISRMEDIQRVFMYHGAEHKCINCIEHGMELNVENVMKSSREHKRCGTSFLMYVIVISIIFFLFIQVDSPVLRVVYRILLVPVIAGVSYEIIRMAGRFDNKAVNLLSKPGLMLQHLTTREPEPDMVEVAIAAVEAVFDWKSYLKENFAEENAEEGNSAGGCCAGSENG